MQTDLLTAGIIAVIEQSRFMSRRSYDLLAMNGAPIGYLAKRAPAGSWFSGRAGSSKFILTRPSGELVATMQRPGSSVRFHLLVTDADDAAVGTVWQVNTVRARQFELRASDGLVMRLADGSFGGTDWELADAADGSLFYGSVRLDSAKPSGMLGGTQRFAVRLAPTLTGASRLLAVMATVCLDYLRGSQDRR